MPLHIFARRASTRLFRTSNNSSKPYLSKGGGENSRTSSNQPPPTRRQKLAEFGTVSCHLPPTSCFDTELLPNSVQHHLTWVQKFRNCAHCCPLNLCKSAKNGHFCMKFIDFGPKIHLFLKFWLWFAIATYHPYRGKISINSELRHPFFEKPEFRTRATCHPFGTWGRLLRYVHFCRGTCERLISSSYQLGWF